MHDGQGTISLRVHLRKAARLVLGRHQKDVCAGYQLMFHFRRETHVSANTSLVLRLGGTHKLCVFVHAAAHHDELHIPKDALVVSAHHPVETRLDSRKGFDLSIWVNAKERRKEGRKVREKERERKERRKEERKEGKKERYTHTLVYVRTDLDDIDTLLGVQATDEDNERLCGVDMQSKTLLDVSFAYSLATDVIHIEGGGEMLVRHRIPFSGIDPVEDAVKPAGTKAEEKTASEKC